MSEGTRRAVVGSVLAAGCGLAYLSISLKPKSRPDPDFAWPETARPRPPVASGLEPARRDKPALLPIEKAASDFDRLVALLGESGNTPVGKKFAEEFMREPALKEAWSDFEEDQKSGAPKTDLPFFARRIGEQAEFQSLVSRFAQEPGFRDVAVSLARMPELNRAITEQVERAEAGRRGGEARSGTRKTGAVARTTGALTRTGGLAGGGAVQAFSASGPGAGRAGAGGSGRGPEASRAEAASAQSAAGRAATGGRGAGQEGPTNAPVGGAHDVLVKLPGDYRNGPVADNTPVSDRLRAWLEAFGIDSERMMADINAHGLWGACFNLKHLSKCAKACEAPPEELAGGCRYPSAYPGYPYFAACLEAGHLEKECVDLCREQQPPCEVPPTLLAKGWRDNPLSALCAGGSQAITPEECARLEEASGKQQGFWHACMQAGLFWKCRGICALEPNAGCPSLKLESEDAGEYTERLVGRGFIDVCSEVTGKSKDKCEADSLDGKGKFDHKTACESYGAQNKNLRCTFAGRCCCRDERSGSITCRVK